MPRADSHVHSEWSWDAPGGSMQASCQRAVEVGLSAIAFTEHVDHTVWRVAEDDLGPDDPLAQWARDGRLDPPPFDAWGYLAAVDECRAQFPELHILSGLELGEPHRHAAAVSAVLRSGTFDRVLGSVHTLRDQGDYAEPPGLWSHRTPSEVLRTYLAEVATLLASGEGFEILAHIDYPVRTWPTSAVPFDPQDFEDEFRHVLRVLAESGRALEVNTRVPLHATILGWWHDVGGSAISFGSDAHDPAALARGFRDAGHLADAYGFRPGRHPHDLWGRVD